MGPSFSECSSNQSSNIHRQKKRSRLGQRAPVDDFGSPELQSLVFGRKIHSLNLEYDTMSAEITSPPKSNPMIFIVNFV